MAEISKRNSHVGPASREEIIGRVGNIDEATIASMLESGATLAEVEEALTWLSGEGEALGKGGFKLAGSVAAVYDILQADSAFAPEEER